MGFFDDLFNNTSAGKLHSKVDPAGVFLLTGDKDKLKKQLDPLKIGMGKDKPAAPTISAPITMPGSDDEAVKAARRRKIAMMQAQAGRESTILSNGDGGAKLGG
jgi:fatty acid/phospholipid biosynthesis enzyme